MVPHDEKRANIKKMEGPSRAGSVAATNTLKDTAPYYSVPVR